MNTTPADLPIATVTPNPDQPRKRFTSAELDELATSIRTHGLLEPIIVRPVGDSFVIVAGERRYRAHVAAGLDSISAIVRDDLDEASAFEVSMVENVIRADMNPVEEAAGYRRLVETGMDVATIASRLGKSTAAINGRLALLRLDGPIQKLIADGQLDAYDGGHMARLSIEGQHRVIRAMNAGQIRYAGDLVRLATAIRAEESAVSMFADDDAPALAPVDLKATRDLQSALAAALAALDKVERSLDAAGVPAETEEIALMGEQMKRRAAALASRVHAQRAAATARQMAIPA